MIERFPFFLPVSRVQATLLAETLNNGARPFPSVKDLVVVGHKHPDTDSVASAVAYAALLQMLHPSRKVLGCRLGTLTDETRFVLKRFRIPMPRLLRDGTGKDLVLVDHNEFSQAVKDIRDAHIVEVIDHHRISGDIKTIAPIPFEDDVRGSCSTIIYERFALNNKPISSETAGLLLSGILSDTLLLKSPTTTRPDREAVRQLSRIAGVDYRSYGIDMLRAGCDIVKHSPERIITADLKEYREGILVAVAQMPVIGMSSVAPLRSKLLAEMREISKKRKYRLFVLMITDILKRNTELLFVGDAGIVQKAFRGKPGPDSLFLKGVVSRKKQVQPAILKAIRALC